MTPRDGHVRVAGHPLEPSLSSPSLDMEGMIALGPPQRSWATHAEQMACTLAMLKTSLALWRQWGLLSPGQIAACLLIITTAYQLAAGRQMLQAKPAQGVPEGLCPNYVLSCCVLHAGCCQHTS